MLTHAAETADTTGGSDPVQGGRLPEVRSARPVWLRVGAALVIVSALASLLHHVVIVWSWQVPGLNIAVPSEASRWVAEIALLIALPFLVLAPRAAKGIAGEFRPARTAAAIGAVATAALLATTEFATWWYAAWPGAEHDHTHDHSHDALWWESIPGLLTVVVIATQLVIGYGVARNPELTGFARWGLLVTLGVSVVVSLTTTAVLDSESDALYDLALSEVWLYLPMIPDLLLAAFGVAILRFRGRNTVPVSSL